MTAVSRGLRASKSSTTRGRPPVMSFVFWVSRGIFARMSPAETVSGAAPTAPTGTAVRSVGDGVVESAGWQGGYGNTVVVRHRNGHSTLYGHLSRVDVRKGQSVAQGQNVGAVGATGTATGPHLHFEFRVNGVHRDPLTLARQSESRPISQGARAAFAQRVQQARVDLAAASSVQLLAVQ